MRVLLSGSLLFMEVYDKLSCSLFSHEVENTLCRCYLFSRDKFFYKTVLLVKFNLFSNLYTHSENYCIHDGSYSEVLRTPNHTKFKNIVFTNCNFEQFQVQKIMKLV